MEENENEQIIASEQDQSATFKDFLTKLYKLEPDIRRKLEENELRLNDNQIFLLISTAKAFSEFLGLVQQLDFDTMRTRVDAKRDEILSTLKDQITKLNSKIITAGPDPEKRPHPYCTNNAGPYGSGHKGCSPAQACAGSGSS